ncbi:MAG: S-layer homology domain-containing protein, partial [bacterium]
MAFAQSAPDPIRIATGARTLGMGKSFVGLSDDISSIFLNPAGLANIDRWQITSMSGKLLEEFNYVSISGLYPTNFGNFGVAYVRSDIGGAFPTTIEAASDPADPIFIIDTNQDPMSYYNNLFILSYGEKLEKFFMLPVLNNVGDRFPWFKQINFGANLKFFAVNLTGDHITQGSASGTEIDLGFQGKPLTWLSLGANVQNLLPTTMGGKLHYETGWDENYPAVLKLGAATNLFGPEESLLQLGQHNVKLLTDLDYEISRSDTIPTLLHLGVEWKPIDLIAIRAGIDQEMEGISSVANNLTSGVGLYYGDFRFDYAYHQFVGAPGVDNHFFSLSYGINPVSKNRERLIASPDQLVTKALVATIEGTAVDPKIVTLKINGLKVSLSPRGNFQARASLKTGKNTILVEGFAFEGDLADAKKLRVLRLLTYPDVPESFWAYQQINHIGTLGIIQGYPDGKFQPEGNITRAELSTLLMRTKMAGDDNVPKASNQVFKDV